MTRAKLSAREEQTLRRKAQDRCGYCLSPQHLVFAPLQIEHLCPIAAGGTDDVANLWLCCSICNGHKSSKVDGLDPQSGLRQRLFNPRVDSWKDHFGWSDDFLKIVGRTAIGRATVSALHLDCDPIAIEVRSYWVAAGWHPPDE